MSETAIILTCGLLATAAAKTAHGLIRASERYRILAVIDPAHAGQDAGTVLDGKARNIPVFADLSSCLATLATRPDFCILGIANAGGRVPEQLFPLIREALTAGVSVVSGLHEYLGDNPELTTLARTHGVSLLDIRRPKPIRDLHFWTGEIATVTCPKIAVLGADCAIGKRTTARWLVGAAREAGLKAGMIYTGQTGWLQGGRYGFILDSTLNDFVSGELEHAIVSCFKETQPDLIAIEGQSALRNPSGPCGSEILLSAEADGVILQYAPARKFYKGWDHLGKHMPSLESEIELIRLYGVPVLAVTLNTAGLSAEASIEFQEQYREKLGIPVLRPLEEGSAPLLEAVRSLMD